MGSTIFKIKNVVFLTFFFVFNFFLIFDLEDCALRPYSLGAKFFFLLDQLHGQIGQDLYENMGF